MLWLMERNFFDNPVNFIDLLQCLLSYAYSRDIYKMIAINLSKQQALLDADPKLI